MAVQTEPWALQPREETLRRAEGDSGRGLTHLGDIAALPLSSGLAKRCFCEQRLTQPSLWPPEGTGWLAC